MMKIRQTLNLSMTVPLAALALTACQPAQLVAHNSDMPTAAQQVQAPQTLAAGTLNGTVATYDGSKFVPVANAQVSLDGTQFTAHTDSDGRYTIAGVAPGAYKVTASKDGMVAGTHDVYMNSVMGTPRVNIALQSPQRTLLDAVPGAQNVTVSGVVTDPRGSALGGAAVKVLSNTGGPNSAGYNSTRDTQGGITSDAAGFYTIVIPNVVVSPTRPGQVQVTANGTSPGGVKLETTDVYAYNLTTATLVANPQCKAFTQPANPTWPNGTFGSMGSNATVKADWLSSRTDEFYVELYCAGSGNNLSQTYGVLPDSITATPANGATPPNGVASFRIPFTMPGPTFVARIVPFGLTSQFGNVAGRGNNVPAPFVTNYLIGDLATKGSFEYDVDFQPGATLVNNTSHTGTANNGLFVSGDNVTYNLSIINRDPSVSQDIQLTGTAPAGCSGISGTYVTYQDNATGATPPMGANGGSGTATAVAFPAGSITGPDASGKFTVGGFTLPLATVNAGGTVTKVGRADLVLNFTSPFGMATGFTFGLSGITTKMVSANLTKALSNPPGVTNGMAASNMDVAQITMGPKVYTNEAGGSNGIGVVGFVVTPTAASAAGQIRITDRCYTNSPVGSSATITGTTVLPAAGTAMGFANGDHIDITTEGGVTTSHTILASWDLETLCAFINVVNPNVTASRDASNHFQVVRKIQGTSNTVQINVSSSASVATKLGLTPGSTALGTNGAKADFTAATAAITGGGAYTFTNTSYVQNSDGSVTSMFTLTPPTAAFTFTAPVTVQYRIQRLDGQPLTLGNGQSAPFGASITAVNTSAAGAVTADQAVTNTGATKPDGTAVSNL